MVVNTTACFWAEVGEMTLYCIYDTIMGVVIEVGRREELLQVVNDVYDGDNARYVVTVWRG